MATPGPISYGSIPATNKGSCMLQIYPPGTWQDQPGYHVFVGGCGVGVRRTMNAAEGLLLAEAIDYCNRAISDAAKIERHYEKQVQALRRDGLRKAADPGATS